MTPELSKCPICGEFVEDGSCPGCGWREQALPLFSGSAGARWYDDIRNLSVQACQHVTQISHLLSDYALSIKPTKDVDVMRETLDDPTLRIISERLEELTTQVFQINDKLEIIDTQTRKPSSLEILKMLIIENMFISIITAILGILGLGRLLGL